MDDFALPCEKSLSPFFRFALNPLSGFRPSRLGYMTLLATGLEKLAFLNRCLIPTLAGKIHLTIFAARWKRGISFFTRLCIFEVMSPPIGCTDCLGGVGWGRGFAEFVGIFFFTIITSPPIGLTDCLGGVGWKNRPNYYC